MRISSLVVVLAGCSKVLGIDDVTLGDGGGSPGTSSSAVLGRVYDQCITSNGMTIRPTDESGRTIQALLPDATTPSGFRVIDGAGHADGTFEIDQVPDGVEYMLRIGTEYYVTTQHALDRHLRPPMRCEPAQIPATKLTLVRFAISDMQPFINGPEGVVDGIEIDSFNLCYRGTRATVASGAIALTSSYSWQLGSNQFDGRRGPLPDAALGDDLWVFHTRLDQRVGPPAERHEVAHLVDMFGPAGLTLQDGVDASVTGSFTPITQNRTIGLTISRGAFDTGWDATAFSGMSVLMAAHPVMNDFAFGVPLMSATFNNWSHAATLTQSISVAYGDPFPDTWARAVAIEYDRTRQLLFPGTTTPLSRISFNGRQLIYTGGALRPVPTEPPATHVAVNGVDFVQGGMVRFDGVTPITVSWTGVATARIYRLGVARLFADGTKTAIQGVASFTTAQTSIRIPANVLAGGQFFAFSLLEIQAPSDYSAGQLIGNGYPFEYTSIEGGLFRLSATCGNGVVDPGEDCDTAGESATCDVDCTAPKCGDGLRNAAAGESCDTIIDTPGCDTDCTMPVCGDGHLNLQVEDCDDGNARDDGNGCTADCKFNNHCGDGIVQSVAEQCDGGFIDTATCNADCTLARCGDGHRNAAAGEECDDGNTSDTDHCTTLCKVN